MPTNDVRREVARRFRDIGSELGTRTPLWWHTAKALGVRTCVDGRMAFCMLADLIDPPDGGLVSEDNIRLIDRCRELECELARVKAELGKLEGDTSLSCRDNVACDRDALLALADELEYEKDLRWIAERIREACGE